MNAHLKLFDGDGAPAPPDAVLPLDPIADPELSFRACCVLWALANWAWGKKPDCWPSNAQIARLLKVSARTVQLGLAELVAGGYVERRMERTATGWHRVLRLTFRAPRLRIHEPGAGAPGARDCATPPQDLAPPPAQALAPEILERGTEENSGPASRPPGAGPTPAGEAEEPPPSPAELETWRDTVCEPGHPLRGFAWDVLARFDPGFLAARGLAIRPERRPAAGPAAKPSPRPAGGPTHPSYRARPGGIRGVAPTGRPGGPGPGTVGFGDRGSTPPPARPE